MNAPRGWSEVEAGTEGAALTREQVRETAAAWIATYRGGHDRLPTITPQVCAAIFGILDRENAPDLSRIMGAAYKQVLS